MYPVGVFLEQSAGEHQELAHEGCDRELGGFSGCGETLIEFLEIGVEAGGNEGRHVECPSDIGAAAANEAFAAPGPGLAGDGCQASQAGGLFGFELAEFRHVTEQHGGGGLGDAGDADEDGVAFG